MTAQITKSTDDNLQVSIDGNQFSIWSEDYKLRRFMGSYQFDALQEIIRLGYAEDFQLDTKYPGYVVSIEKDNKDWIIYAEDHEDTEFPRFRTKKEAVEYATEWALHFCECFIENFN